ncbi:serine/threonine-protein kinase Nek5-like isoform X9 [Panicum virgatum]|uniref:serine/threonine-protein kinase Nek5-like isoform X9 n=1 Tax=Panicum virgatum TaxID=38727 RepID=UPI0019D64609|nr:serine/threonine-protein kinase Nek5-like isoform X9 [Panicum virgatum]
MRGLRREQTQNWAMSIKSIKPLEAGYSFDGQRFDHVGGDAGVPPRLLRRLRVHGARERRRCRVWQGEHDGAVRGGGGARRRGEVPGAHRQVQADPRCVRSSCSSRHLMMSCLFWQMLLIATVRNPFIVEYNDSWVEKGCYVCIIIGYCEGRDVRIVREETCMYVLEKSASGLCSFSWLFIICMLDRDVKCSNIFIARDQSIRLVIFQFCIPCETYIAPDESTGVLYLTLSRKKLTVHLRSAVLLGWHSFMRVSWWRGCVSKC